MAAFDRSHPVPSTLTKIDPLALMRTDPYSAQTFARTKRYIPMIFMAGKTEKALPHLDYLVSGDADTVKIEWVEAFLRVCMDLQRKGKAFKKINRLLHKNSSNPDLWKIMAQFHLWQNDYKSALAALGTWPK